MSWYEIRITPDEKKHYVTGGRLLLVWDERPKAKIIQQLDEKGSVILARASFKSDKSAIVGRGTIAIFAGHIISIEDRIDLNAWHPKGPVEQVLD